MYVAASSQFEFLKNSVVAEEPGNVNADDTVESTDERKSQNRLTYADKIALAKHNQFVSTTAAQTGKKPNILCICGDDIGVWNLSQRHATSPGAIWHPEAGRGKPDPVLWQALLGAVQDHRKHQPKTPIIVFCRTD